MEKAGVKAVVEGYDQYERQIKSMGKVTGDLGDDLQKGSGQANSFGKSVAGTALGFGAAEVGLKALKGAFDFGIGSAMSFQKGLSDVGAVSGATTEEMGGLSAAALRIGADTAFSATQAVGAFESLAANGLTATEIMGGAADATAALAAAGGVDLVLAADTASTAMSVWGIKTGELNEVVNRLAGAANTSRFGVEDMSAAIASGGGAAATAGVDFGDFTTVIAATANAFSSGSDAGTSFKTFITALPGNSKEAKQAIKDLGLSFYDLNGNLRPMPDIVQQLHDKLGPLSQEAQTVALKTIFGNDAFRTAAGLMKLTGTEFEAMSDKMKNTDASEVARQRMDNLSGRMEALKGSVETVGISIGMKLIPALTEMAEGAAKAVNAFGELPKGTQNIVLAGAALTALVPIAVKATTAMANFVKGMRAAEGLSTGAKLTGIAAGLVAVGIATDAILQKTTGHGLIEWVFGDPQQADKTSAAIDRVTLAVKNMGEGADKVAISLRELAAARAKTAEEYDNYEKKLLLGNELSKDERAAMEAVIVSVGGAKASYEDLAKVRAQLNATEQAYFDKKVGWTAQEIAHTNAVEGANQAARDSAVTAPIAAGAIATVVVPTLAAATAADTAAQDFDTLALSLGDVEKGTRNYNKALDELIGRFADANPAVHQLQMANAFLAEELEDLKAKTDPLTAAEQARVEVLEKAIEKNDKLIEGYASNQKALEGAKLALQEYMGPAALGGLLTLLDTLKVPQEDQIDLLKNIGLGYTQLSTKDVPGAIKTFGDLKATLSPEVWEPIAKAIGPEFVKAIADGYSGPEKENLLRAAGALLDDAGAAAKNSALIGGTAAGKAYVDGLVAGLRSGAAQTAFEVMSQIDALIAAGQAGLQTGSPSKVTRDLLGIPFMEGIAQGINEGSPIVIAAVAQGITDINLAAVQAMTASEPIVTTAIATSFGNIIGRLQDELGNYTEMSKAEIEDLFKWLASNINSGALSEATRQEFEGLYTAMKDGWKATGSLSNAEVIHFVNELDRALSAGFSAWIETSEAGWKVIQSDHQSAWSVVDGITQGGVATLQQTTVNGISNWQHLLDEGLRAGSEMSQGELGQMFSELTSIVANAQLPEATNKKIAEMFYLFTQGIAEGKGVANADLIAWLEELQHIIDAHPLVVAPPIIQTAAGNGGQTVTEGGVQPSGPGPATPVNGTIPAVPGMNIVWVPGQGWQYTQAPFGGQINPDTGVIEIGPGNTIPSLDVGMASVPFDMLAFLHKGEGVLTAAENRERLRVPGPTLPASWAGGGGGPSITFDLRGSTFTGTREENEAMMRRVANDAMSQAAGRGRFLAGSRLG